MLNFFIKTIAFTLFIVCSPYYVLKFIKDYYFPKFKAGEYCWMKGRKDLGFVVIQKSKPFFFGTERHYRVRHSDIHQLSSCFPTMFPDFDDLFTAFVPETELEKVTELEKSLYL